MRRHWMKAAAAVFAFACVGSVSAQQVLRVTTI
ncbi:MAG: hypothetical protein RL676_427, partial [Pseudomonadota bacterium]